MGVPALFRWLSTKYPKIISPVVEDPGDPQFGRIPQYLDPNPNGELDNLYLDMNGIVHPCSHPEHKPAPETEDEMFLDVFRYTDRVLMMARPRKVLMIAVDGVAPRAKMNQQRARRFRAANDAKIAHEAHEEHVRECEARGQLVEEAVKGKRKWDTNAITPGTPFMDGLARALRYWVAYKLASDPGWADLQVIISDATVPGEGEHKLMSFIRTQRADPQYDPNTRHCIYGLDADLIFLGLATHEPHFRVLREDVFAQSGRRMRPGEMMSQEQKLRLDAEDASKPFLWLHVNVLREYLEVELRPRGVGLWDPERAIDDWVFMCFFVGNDFLPHFPSLSVRDNGIDILVQCWKLVVLSLHDYITCDGKLNLDGVERLLGALAKREDSILYKKHEHEIRNDLAEKRRRVGRAEETALRKQFSKTVSKGHERAPVVADVNMPLMDTKGNLVEGYAQLSNKDIVHNQGVITQANMANADAASALRKLLAEKANGDKGEKEEAEEKNEDNNEQKEESVGEENGEEAKKDEATTEDNQGESDAEYEPQLADTDSVSSELNANGKRSAAPDSESGSTSDSESDTEVRMGQPGYRDRYYRQKFHAQTAEEVADIRRKVVRAYLEGIAWVLLYYYQGCPSWQWYYPYHYAPFAADFTDIRDLVGPDGLKFELGTPFNPYEQLMAVLPAASGHTLPEVFRELMTSPDSSIIDFYPEEFAIDMNGAKMSWQGIALLPFIDETRLLEAVRGKYHLLTEAERDRNTNKSAQLYISSANKNYKRFSEEFAKENEISFHCRRTGLAGSVKPVESFSDELELPFPLNEGDMPNVDRSAYLQAWYAFPPAFPGKSMLLNGYIAHDRVLNEADKYAILSTKRNNFNRFRNTSDYVNGGPSGTEIFRVFSMRPGGYRASLELGNRKSLDLKYADGSNRNYGQRNNDHRSNQNYGQNNYGNQNYNQSNQNYGNQNYNSRGGYNNYNQGYNLGQNNLGYNNLSYNNQGYNNQGYNNLGYNNLGYNNLGYNNLGYNNLGYNDQSYNLGSQGYNRGLGQGNNGYQNNRYQNQDQNRNSYRNSGYNGNRQDNYSNSRSGYMPPRR